MAEYSELDLHCQMILDEYRELLPVLEKTKGIVYNAISACLKENGLLITALEARVKAEDSLAGKLELKGYKYKSLSDITDILGLRIITFYTDDVDKIAALMTNLFTIYWESSVDKRKMHELDSFGYNSLHYICSIPTSLYFDPEHPEINGLRFEIQMRTTLQHMWANMYHDTGYKSGVEIPHEYLRNLNRLAGMLELADDEFSRIRTSISDYRRRVQALVASGELEEVPLNGDTYSSYLKIHPFDQLNSRIAAINQAEVTKTSLMPYLEIFKAMGFKTLKDIQDLINTRSDAAFELAASQIGATDIDIISSTVAVQNLCFVHILMSGVGEVGLTMFFNILNGDSEYNKERAHRIAEQASKLSFMKK